MSTQNGFALIPIVLGVIITTLIIGSAYFLFLPQAKPPVSTINQPEFSPNPEPILVKPGWKEVSISKFYNLNVPVGYSVLESALDSPNILEKIKYLADSDEHFTPNFTITVYKSLSDNKQQEILQPGDLNILETKDIELAGVKGKRIDGLFLGKGEGAPSGTVILLHAPESFYFEIVSVGKVPLEEILLTLSSISSGTEDLIVHSPDNKFYFYYYPAEPPNSERKCNFFVRGSDGKTYDIKNLLEYDTIKCNISQENEPISFRGWANGHRMLFDDQNGTIKIVDLDNNKASSYTYDKNKLKFFAANKDLKYWLFFEDPVNRTSSFVILDNEKNIVFESSKKYPKQQEWEGWYQTYYDFVNDGFLFTDRYSQDNWETIGIKIDYLSLDTLEIRNLLTSEPIDVVGRGCPRTKILSQKVGEVIIGGCIATGVPERYKSADHRIHLKL